MGILDVNEMLKKGQFDGNDCGVACVINVSDQAFYAAEQTIGEAKVPYFWYPVLETRFWDWAIIGAVAKIYWAFKDKGTVIIHCHAGINRSASLAYLLKYVEHNRDGKKALAEITTFSDPEGRFRNNINQAHLPMDIVTYVEHLRDSDHDCLGNYWDKLK